MIVSHGRPVFIPSEKLKKTKKYFADAIAQWNYGEQFEKPVYIKIIWVFPYKRTEKKSIVKSERIIPKSTRPDIDNLQKALLDELTKAGVISDDSIVSRLTLEKCWGKDPGIFLKIVELDNSLFEESVRKSLSLINEN